MYKVDAYFLQYEVATATDRGVEITGPHSVETNWDVATYVKQVNLLMII